MYIVTDCHKRQVLELDLVQGGIEYFFAMSVCKEI